MTDPYLRQTAELRWLLRDGDQVLQQLHYRVDDDGDHPEWIDVPVVTQ